MRREADPSIPGLSKVCIAAKLAGCEITSAHTLGNTVLNAVAQTADGRTFLISVNAHNWRRGEKLFRKAYAKAIGHAAPIAQFAPYYMIELTPLISEARCKAYRISAGYRLADKTTLLIAESYGEPTLKLHLKGSWWRATEIFRRERNRAVRQAQQATRRGEKQTAAARRSEQWLIAREAKRLVA